MEYEATWRPPVLPDVHYDLHVEFGEVIANLTLTVQEVEIVLIAISNNGKWPPHWSRPWWVTMERGRPVIKIYASGSLASLCVSFPGEQVQGVLEEIIEHASQQEDDEA